MPRCMPILVALSAIYLPVRGVLAEAIQGSAPFPANASNAERPPVASKLLANRIDEIGPMLMRCLQFPPENLSRPGTRITLRLAFTRDGEILGEPRFTFTTPGVPTEIKVAYQRSIVEMLNRCTPLPITKELGEAIAGRPFALSFVDTRGQSKI
jgi:hypothetical protein